MAFSRPDEMGKLPVDCDASHREVNRLLPIEMCFFDEASPNPDN
jgi:hypothetical protein